VKNLLSNPWTRLAARALLVAIVSALAFCEVFTPLNALVGVFKRTTVKPT
jgi:hypothetical protein